MYEGVSKSLEKAVATFYEYGPMYQTRVHSRGWKTGKKPLSQLDFKYSRDKEKSQFAKRSIKMSRLYLTGATFCFIFSKSKAFHGIIFQEKSFTITCCKPCKIFVNLWTFIIFLFRNCPMALSIEPITGVSLTFFQSSLKYVPNQLKILCVDHHNNTGFNN